ncbi:D-2-hydroxyacid dehydrogenase [Lentisalinibacter sediminis]|uniref:D-2-hydroxyacid dehydrogenase n=1 Tax=Lentisalinibacter sediminis TaxID=2992237 RepID=UPI00386391AE
MKLSEIYRRQAVIVCCAVALVMAAPLGQARPAAADADTRELISELGLSEGETPVREHPRWQSGGPILVAVDGPQRLAWLQAVAGEAELVAVQSRAEAEAVLPGAVALLGICSAELIEAGESLHWVQSYSAGVDRCVDTPALAERDMILTNAQRLYGPAIAEHVMGMMFMLARGLDVYHLRQADGRWERGLEDYADSTWELADRTLLVVGLGGIGTEIARRAHALGMKVIATRASSRQGPPFVSYVGLAHELHTLAGRADIIVNATPLVPATEDLFDAEFFAAAKPGSYFINIGRGGSVVTEDLLAALESGRIAGAGLDVTDPEPLPEGHPLWRMPRVVITPHISARTEGSSERRWLLVRENLRRYVAGEPLLSVVDIDKGY